MHKRQDTTDTNSDSNSKLSDLQSLQTIIEYFCVVFLTLLCFSLFVYGDIY